MRYSFFGRSDWRSPASVDRDLLFDDARLEKRAVLLEKISLQSLVDQQDDDFVLILLSSAGMPARHKRRVETLAMDMLGDRAHVLFEEPERAAYRIDQYRRTRIAPRSAYITQSILDDDDAVSVRFVDRIKREAAAAVSLFHARQDYAFISHAKGVNLIFGPDGHMTLRKRNMPAAAQGLTLLSQAGAPRSPFNIAHKKMLDRRPVRVIHGGPVMYLRSVHDTNDSRALIGGTVMAPEEIEAVADTELPLLQAYLPQLVGNIQAKRA